MPGSSSSILRSTGSVFTQQALPFDALCRTARDLFDVPVASICLPGEQLSWIDTGSDIDRDAWAFATTFPQQAPGHSLPIWIADATQDGLLANQRYVTQTPGLRFLASIPLGPDGQGRLTLFDIRPRPGSPDRLRQLQDLAALADACLALLQNAHNAIAGEQDFRLLAETSTDTIVRGNLEGTRLYISPSVRTLLGYEPEELIGRKASELVHPDDAASFGAMMGEVRAGRLDVYVAEMRQRHKNGHWVWMEAAIRLTRDPATGAPNGYVTSVRDIARRKELEAKLAHLASYDLLTGLPNRALFTHQLDEAFEALGKDARRGFSLLYMDLDRFKQVNDTLGHQAGDAVLRDAAARFQAMLRSGDIVARLGGDEFTIILRAHRQEAEMLAKRLIAAIQAPFQLDPGPVNIGLSIGIAQAPQDGAEPDALLSAADAALYAAKAAGRNTYRLCSD